jgi:uncharacterized protein YozE (UPF0346 family)
MTPKEKASELANKMYKGSPFHKTKEQHILECETAKKDAITAVNEFIEYWQQVKAEIENL